MTRQTRIARRGTAALLAAGTVLLTACTPHAEKQPAVELPPVSVHVAQASRGVIPLQRELPGTVRPRDYAQVSARVMGLVAEADFAVGQEVERGTPLVLLSAAEIDARVAQARTALEQARLDYEREAGLLQSGATTRERVRTFDERQRIAAAALTEAETQLGYTRIEAPFSGRITSKHVNAGDLATPGSPLFDLENHNVLRVEVQVPESLPELPLGGEVSVMLGGDKVRTRIAESSPAADPQTRTRLVKLDLPSESGARSGQFARVLWPEGETEAVVVPESVITLFGQMERVFVLNDGHAELRLVKTGARLDGKAQVLAGLDGGETVVTHPPAALANGQPLVVEIQ